MNIKSFSNWYSSVKEAEAQAEVSQPTAIINDVDNIINSLETLASELTEELSEIEDHDQVEEGAGDFIKDWIASMKAAKSQQKVNKIKMNATDLQFAADKAEGKKKDALSDKSKTAKDQGIELQKMVDDKFSGKGPMTASKLSKEKIKGQVEIIKRTTGMEDDPKKKADLKSKMQELAKKAQEEDAAMAELEDKNKEAIEAEKERIAKEEKKKKEAAKEPEAKEPETKEPETKEPEAKEPETKEPEAKEPEAKEPETKEPETKEPETKEPETKDDGEPKKKKVQDSLIIRAKAAGLNELASDIESKLDWQVAEGTILASNYDAIIKKSESDKILNESKYQVNSVKDAFRRLM